jgi:Zn-dependent protease/CBS domain-containing protein
MSIQRSTSTLRVGRLAGIPIGIQPLWLVIVAFLTYTLGHDYFRVEDPGLTSSAAYALGLASALGLFAGIVLHELGHAIVARRRGIAVDEIDLWLLGGVSRLHDDARRPADELAFALAGPAVTAVLLVVLGALSLAVGDALPAWGDALLTYQLLVSAMILAFNLLPAFPLDGGRVARSLLWRRYGDKDRATIEAARIGRAFGWGIGALGALTFVAGAAAGIWLMLVGGFLVIAASAEARHTRIEQAFGATTVGEIMTSPVVTVGERWTLRDAAAQFATHLFTAFPVVDGAGHAVGILMIDDVRHVPPIERLTTTVGDVASRAPELLVDPATPISDVLERPDFGHAGRAVVVDERGAAVGIVSITDIERRMRADDLTVTVDRLAA